MPRKFTDWLRRAPVRDPIDRQNAPTMQVLLAFNGATLALSWTWHLTAHEIPDEWRFVFVMDIVTIVVAFIGVALIRLGRFRVAVKLYLACLVASNFLTYRELGSSNMLMDQATMILILVVSGLVLGRRALWTAFGLVVAILVTGFITDWNALPPGKAWNRTNLANAPGLLLSYTVITLVLDRTVDALRRSLAEADARSRALRREVVERERTQAQLIQSQKREATGRLAAGVAHDFGNLLSVIKGFTAQRDASALLPDAGHAAAMEQALAGIEEVAERGMATTRKLLTFNRDDELHLEWFSPGDVLQGLRPVLSQLFPPDIQMEIDAPDPGWQIHLDRNEFELMLLNVGANARDAMPGGGRFRVQCRPVAGNRLELRMCDTGSGMDDATRDRVFQPFFSTKPRDKGTGLGLSVVHDLVEVAGGEIGVESAPGEGTCIWILFPARHREATPATPGLSPSA